MLKSSAVVRDFGYDRAMQRTTIAILAWVALLAIAAATLSPLGLRPHMAPVAVERFGAFAVIGLLFGLAYSRHPWRVAVLISGVALGLELMQHLTPDRHGHLADALVKLAGGIVGVGLSLAITRLAHPKFPPA